MGDVRKQQRDFGPQAIGQFTPGPWRVGRSPLNEHKSGQTWDVPVFADNGPEWGKIAAEAIAPDREMARANARLIAAAPEGYTLADKIRSVAKSQTGINAPWAVPTVEEWNEMVYLAQKFFAKADGQS